MTDGKSSPLVPQRRFPEFAQGPEWDHAKVADLVETITPPKKLTTSAYLAVGRFPIIDQSQSYICGWTNDDEAVIARPLPVIVFGDHTCALKFVDRPFAQGADGIKILTARRGVSTVYLYHQLTYLPVVMEEYKRHFSALKDKVICFPDPKSGEQQKIADCCYSACKIDPLSRGIGVQN
jgi:type I restriction enzyme, S subunit